MNRLAALIVELPHALLFFLCISSAHGAGPTGEEETLAELQAGRFPIALSADGKWLQRVDAKNILYRESVTDSKSVQSIALGNSQVLSISPSRTGRKIAFIRQDGCIGIASFTQDSTAQPRSSNPSPSISWLGASVSGVRTECGIAPFKAQDGGDFYRPAALALSNNGELIALGGNPVRVINITSGKTVYEIPTSDVAVLHLKFLDSDRKLLVVHALLGEQWESAATGSDMRFAIWDLQKKELFNFHSTGKYGNLFRDDFNWSFSEETGQLWAINTDGRIAEADAKNPEKIHFTPIQPYTINLKQCAAEKQPKIKISQSKGEWLDFAADPQGRWLAVVNPEFNSKLKRYESRLVILDSKTAKILAQWHLDAALLGLTFAQDGKAIYGITKSQHQDITNSPSNRSLIYQGGRLMKFDLSSNISALEAEPIQSWSTRICLVEDEVAHARDISINTAKRPKVFDIPLDARVQANRWRQMPDGTLWVDRWTTLESINPQDGSVLLRIPTPRSDSVSSIPIYDQRQFLNWQGDTISLRPFGETLSSGNRKLLVKKPGWSARMVEFLGESIGVRWIQSRFVDSFEEGADGSALAIVYDKSGNRLHQKSGRAISGNAYFEGEDEGDDVFAEYRKKITQDANYQWERSYMGSIRARRLSGGASQTIFWHGLKLGFTLPDGQVTNLHDGLGAYFNEKGIKVYDAEKRQELASIKLENVAEVAWNNQQHVLLVEVYPAPNSKKNIPLLHAYRIE